MKHSFALLAAALTIAAISCQQIEIEIIDRIDEVQVEEQVTPITITATLAPVTKVTYEETVDHKLKQTWEVDDVLVGIDDIYNDITMRVASVDGSGVATLEITKGALPLSGSIHMMYGVPALYGDPAWSSMLSISSQSVATGTTVPAILTADATVSGSSLNLSFVNRTAILGIKGFHGLPADAVITRFIITGVYSMASASVSEGVTTITSSPYMTSIVVSKATAWTANASGEVDDVFYVAAFPNDTPTMIAIQAELEDGSYYCNQLGEKAVAAAKYYYMNDKNLRQVVAYVNSTPYFSIDDAIAAANTSGGNSNIQLVSDCSASQELYINASNCNVSLNLNGKTLDLNGYSLNVATDGGSLAIGDMMGGGCMAQTGGSSLLYATNGTVDIRNAVFDCSGSGRILRMDGGEVNIHNGTSFIQRPASTYMMYVNGGTLNIDGGEFEHKSATGYSLIYNASNNPAINITGGVFKAPHTSYYPFTFATTTSEVNIGGDAVFINTGTQHTFYVGTAANSNNVHITGGYFTSSKVCNSANSNVVTLSGGYYRSSSLTITKCSYKTSHSNRNVYPSVTREGYTFGYRISHNSTQRWGFSVADGDIAYPAQYNCKYTPSTSTWAFQSAYEGYTSGYNADEVNLFTWGLPSEYTNPASATGLMGMVGDQDLDEEDDWAHFMPSDGLFTPTMEQWEYLLNTRSASTVNGVANARYMKCTFQDSKGLLIFPDSFTWPANAGLEYDATAINDPLADFSITYYRSQAGYLAGAGCIFLRADGYREGTSDRELNSAGYYWSSTMYGSNQPWFLYFDKDVLTVGYAGGMTVDKGAAVRVFSR